MERKIKDSQNFLHNKKLVRGLVANSNININDIVYEIGPGKGIITEQLLNVSKKVIAIELDNSLYQLIKQTLISEKLTLVNQDFMTVNLPDGNYKVFSNIPFNMTGEILTKLLTAANPPQDMYIIMQYEAMLKYAGTPYYKDSLKSLMFKPLYEIKPVYEFQPSDFKPKPNVSIVLVHFHKKEYCDIKKATMLEYWDFLSFIYTARLIKQKQRKFFMSNKNVKKNHEVNEELNFSD